MNGFPMPGLLRKTEDMVSAPAFGKVNILIVDDLPEKLLVYEMALAGLGQNLVMARSGKEALRLLLQQEFAVILLDVNMPEMDGFETAMLIRSRKKSAHTPIIFLTAFTDEMRVNQGYATGAVDYLPTPVVPQILQAKVKVFIELFLMRQQAASQAEERARRIMAEEADRHKDQFLGMLAHELRNPLGPVLNAVYLLKSMDSGGPQGNNLLEIIERQVMHMSRLVEDLLDATRLARGQILLRKTQCDLGAIVRDTAKDYRGLLLGDDIKLVIQVPPMPVWVEGDSTRLAQVIGNLLHNAHKYTPVGGEVSVCLACNEEDGIVKIDVSDSGIGIMPFMLPRVFDVFYQAEQGLDRNRGGLGLGLALVKGLVELHGGRVAVQSAGENKGATFTVFLPYEPAEETHHSFLPVFLPFVVEKRRVLIIEDNLDAAETVRAVLETDGHDVRMCQTGGEGLDVARTFNPDIILCDIGLPQMDGYQVASAVRANHALRHVYLVALTGYGREEDREQAQRAGFNAHLTKPLDPDYLRRAVGCLAQSV